MKQKERDNTLTDRERQIIKLIAGGYNDDEISQMLGISTTYIRANVVNSLLKRTGTTNRPSLVYYALSNGII